MKIILLIIFSICFVAPSVANDKLIRLGMVSGGAFPPYTIKENNKPSSGIIVDILQSIALKHGYRVKIVSLPKKRIEQMLRSGFIDAAPMAKEWVSNHEYFEFTAPLIDTSDVVFSLQETPLHFQHVNDLSGKVIGTHIGYKYPTLEARFREGDITRYDTASERALLKMLLARRIDAAVINEAVGLWFVKEQGWENKFFISKKAVDSVGYRIMFSKQWKPFVLRFDRELNAMKLNGSVKLILDKYR